MVPETVVLIEVANDKQEANSRGDNGEDVLQRLSSSKRGATGQVRAENRDWCSNAS